ncbi:hypothetical protein F511_08860 [Dorcoceras hygrometricum]|uniref:Uncharacterized protein n=1 Tax=Dorcoceras hygrometricum TaxID=472368 RepID=A0A2Z7APV1_9LAMI|nr:hypothetical protein F511_08860 [Dorcoceras hygrometricum]
MLVNVAGFTSAVSVIQIRVSVNRSKCWDMFSQCDVVFLVLAGNPDATPYCLVAQSAASAKDVGGPAGTPIREPAGTGTVKSTGEVSKKNNSASLKLEKKSVDGISHMLKRYQQELSFKCVSVAELQTTKEVLFIKRDFRISAEDESSRQRFQQKRIAVKE